MFNNVKLDEKIIKKNKIPVLIKDKEWKSLFRDNLTKAMKKLVDRLEELLAEEKECMKELRNLKKQKKVLMEKILKLSDEANSNNDEGALYQLEESRNRILKINEVMDELEFKLETLPKEIERVNFELLRETVAVSYTFIKEDRKRLEFLDVEIQRIRKILGDLWEEKFEKEKRINELYLYLHGTLGHEETDKLDSKFL